LFQQSQHILDLKQPTMAFKVKLSLELQLTIVLKLQKMKIIDQSTTSTLQH